LALELPLERLQRWMFSVVVHPGTRDEAVASAAAQADVPADRLADVILPSPTLSPVERVGVYHGMYLLRMEEALSTDYPGLKHLLGDRAFMDLVARYVQLHPSRSYTLNRLGDHFPEYVASDEGLRRREPCADLARLELAVSQVFDAPETPPLSAEAVAAVPAEAWERARLVPIPAFRLLALRYPVSAYLDSLSAREHAHPKLRRKESCTAVYRRSYAVWRQELSRPAHDLLADLAAGRTLGEAVGAAVARGGRRGATEDQLFKWFREWVAAGLFAEVVLPRTWPGAP
jgi:hypothetical protein